MATSPIVLYTPDQIHRRVVELARALDSRFADGATPHLIGVLSGGFVFLADLVRAMSRPVTVDFVRLASYGSATVRSTATRLLMRPAVRLEDRDVVLVEDIVDTGHTLDRLRREVLAERPRSLSTVALLAKPSRRAIDVPVDLIGFEVGPAFVVGYGLDLDERHRELPYIATLENS